jgi:dTDP-glucose pyrophosphorylase/CBS domain-containing protein
MEITSSGVIGAGHAGIGSDACMIGRQITQNLDEFCVLAEKTIRETIACIERSQKGIALVVDAERRLLGTITDGDVRRGLIAGLSTESLVRELLKVKSSTPFPHHISVPVGTERSEILQIMREKSIRQVPLLDDNGHMVDLVTINDLVPEDEVGLQALIMAGGFGTRLRPLTDDLPKPMLPVGGRPLLEHMIEHLRDSGVRRVGVATHYQSEKITDYFGNGEGFGVDLRYVPEDRPLGTAGALSLLEDLDSPLLVINGDILTRINIRAMLEYHREHGADLTVAVREYDVQVPFGVVDCQGAEIKAVNEKPIYKFFVNGGIYLLEPRVNRFVPSDQTFNMTDLIKRLLDEGRSVVGFPVMEYWLDIGRIADYEKAQEDVKLWENKL